MKHETKERDCSRYGTKQDVGTKYGYTTKTVDRYVDKGILPKPIRFSARCLRFDMEEVRAYVEKAKQDLQGPTLSRGMP